MKVDLRELEAILRGLPKRFERAAIAAMRETAAEGVGIVVAEIDQVKAVYNGDLRRSVRYSELKKGAMIRVDAPHAPIIEYGRRPGRMPPREPIALWAVRKLGVPQEEADEVSWRIASAIAKNGIKPRHFFRRAMRKVRQRLEKNLKTHLDAEFGKAK